MVAECHSVVRAPAVRVTRVDSCCNPVDSACAYAVSESFVTIALTKVLQERQEALQLNANGDVCVDKPKGAIFRYYEVVITFCGVDPELFNIVSGEPIVLNDAATPVAVGWSTVVGSATAANFALEFWTGTDETSCDEGEEAFGYGVLPCLSQGIIGDVTIENGVANFTVTALSKAGVSWGVGPYNVLVNETGVNAGLPGPMLTPIATGEHKRFFWTELPPPDGQCGCQDLTPEFSVLPLVGPAATQRTATFPVDGNGDPILPAVIDWDDATPNEVVTSGTSATHTYVAGSYEPTYTPTGVSSPVYVSPTVTVS